jgi:hypothetical protein
VRGSVGAEISYHARIEALSHQYDYVIVLKTQFLKQIQNVIWSGHSVLTNPILLLFLVVVESFFPSNNFIYLFFDTNRAN